MQCVKPRPCLDFFFFYYSSLLTQFLSLITHHLKYPNSLHEVCLAPSLKYFYYFVGPILTHSQALIILSLSLSLFGLFCIGLYGDLPPPFSANEDKPSNTTIWSSSAKMALPTLRRSSWVFASP